MHLVVVEGPFSQEPRFVAILEGVLVEVGSAAPTRLELPNIYFLLCWEFLIHLLTSGPGCLCPCCLCILSHEAS